MSIIFSCPDCKKLNDFCDSCMSLRSVMKFLFNSEEDFIEHIRNLAKDISNKHKKYGPTNEYAGPYFNERSKIEEIYGVFFGTQKEYDYYVLGNDEDLSYEECRKIEEDNDKNTTPLAESQIIILDKNHFPKSYPAVMVLWAEKGFDCGGRTEIFLQEYIYLSDFKL